jgi:TetR/AcrR family transcriptional regulator, regulator of autoinduction and epiphytic fitness
MGGGGEGFGDGRAIRPYRSEHRAEQALRTRRRILEAAHRSFLERGYAGTTFRRVATAAGVSVGSVEQAFGTKARLLERVIDVAIAGDDEPVPVLDRAWAAEASAASGVPAFLEICARLLTAGQNRSAGLGAVLAEAATADPALRPLADQRLAQRSATATWVVDGIVARSTLRAGVDRPTAVDTVWVLMDPVLYGRLVDDRGWAPERYARWFADTVQRLLLPASDDG